MRWRGRAGHTVLCLSSVALLTPAGTLSSTQAQGPQLRIGSRFEQQLYLKASNTNPGDKFGILAISGDTMVVSAREEFSDATGVNGNQGDNSAAYSGAAYVFVRNGTSWSQQAYLKASNTDGGDLFGWSVAISGDTIVVGAQGEASIATGVNGDQSDNTFQYIGAAYVFTRTGTQWSQQAYLKASNTTATNAAFGYSVAIDDDTLVVGANNSEQGTGSAYVFARSGTTWSQQAYLKGSNTESLDIFGQSVAIYGDTLVIGAYREDSNATGSNGDQSNNSVRDSGAVYIFTRNGTVWSQETYLKASNTGVGDTFGVSVALSDDTLVVGAWEEASNATGSNGDQSSNSVPEAGAAYVFTRSGTQWSQQAYLKASNPGLADFFGRWVRMFDDTLVVGANHESSNATGVNGDQSDNSVPEAGAAYVFTREGTVWSQQAYLKATVTGVDDRFGRSVDISEDTIVVGAFLEDSNATGSNGDPHDNSMPDAGAVYVFDYSFDDPDDGGAAPTAPSKLKATAISTSEIELNWKDNSANENEFRVEMKPPGNAFRDLASVAANSIGTTVTELLSGTTYRFRVRARNASADSPYSNQAKATTDEGEPPPGSTDPCFRNNQTACLLDGSVGDEVLGRGSIGHGGGRFEVTVTMRDFANPPDGPGDLFSGMIQHYDGESSETDQAVSFYSFEEGNGEIFVKMVDACSSGFSSFWVFAAGATNAETVILIRDTWTGQVYRIDNPRGGDFFFPPDTQAFKTCDATQPGSG